MLHLQEATPLTHLLQNASASEGKPPDPIWYDIVPDLCWISPRGVKENNIPPFNM